MDDENDIFLSVDPEQGSLVAIPLRDGHIVFDVQDWEEGRVPEESSVSEIRYVMTIEEFRRLVTWGQRRL